MAPQHGIWCFSSIETLQLQVLHPVPRQLYQQDIASCTRMHMLAV